jgi:hypothetical protein
MILMQDIENELNLTLETIELVCLSYLLIPKFWIYSLSTTGNTPG